MRTSETKAETREPASARCRAPGRRLWVVATVPAATRGQEGRFGNLHHHSEHHNNAFRNSYSVVRASCVGPDMITSRFGLRVFRPLTLRYWGFLWAGGAPASRDAGTADPLCQDVQ